VTLIAGDRFGSFALLAVRGRPPRRRPPLPSANGEAQSATIGIGTFVGQLERISGKKAVQVERGCAMDFGRGFQLAEIVPLTRRHSGRKAVGKAGFEPATSASRTLRAGVIHTLMKVRTRW
jgi:hypothetical protein